MRKWEKESRELKQVERIQNRENLVEEDKNLPRFFELPPTKKLYVNRLKSHENNSDFFSV